MIFPHFIKKGSTIGIIAPAGRIDIESIRYAEKLLIDRGFKVEFGEHVLNAFYQFAGNDAHRLSDLQQMLDRQDIEAILCARGGYGAIRIVNELDWTGFLKHPKWIVGYSDITVLHSVLQNQLGMASIHGIMPKNYSSKLMDDPDMDWLFRILMGNLPSYHIPSHQLNKTGSATGELTGGNLSLLYALRGTKYDIDPKGKILFIEDVGEYLYHLDRMIHNLKLGGILEQISGLVVGQFSEMKDNDTPFGFSAYEIVHEAVKDYNYPVLFNFMAGHSPLNLPLVFGKTVTLHVTSEGAELMF
jgi:muramoyltetrapeptide carboxypeptidase